MRISKIIKKIPLYALILPAWILMISCGKEEGEGRYYDTNRAFQNYPPNVANLINSVQCQFNEGRFNLKYHTNAAMDGQGNPTTIQGALTPGGLGGSPTSVYIGQGGSGDLIVVSKMSGNSNSVEVTLSLCRQSVSVSQDQKIPFVSERRPPTAQLGGSIVVAPRTNCSAGAVSMAFIGLTIPTFPYSANYNCGQWQYTQYGWQWTNKTCSGQLTAPATGVNINFAPGPCQ